MINIEADGSDIIYWGRDFSGDVYKKKIQDFHPHFYVKDSNGKYLSCFGDKLKKIITRLPGDVPRQRIMYPEHFEADILYTNRFSVDRFDELEKEEIKFCHLDIETESGPNAPQKFPDVMNPKNKILVFGTYNSFSKEYKIFCLCEEFEFDICEIEFFDDEIKMIKSFCKFVRSEDFDLFSGYYIEKFDMMYIINRMKKLGMDRTLLSRDSVQTYIDDYNRIHIWGRDVFDVYYGIRNLKSGERQSWKLNDVGQDELGYGKTEYEGELWELWEKDKKKFMEYNFTDVKLLVDLDKKFGMINHFDEIRRISKCGWGNIFTTNIVNDCLLLQFCKGRYILPSVSKKKKESYEGAHTEVYGSGLFKNVLVFDYKALYPTIMMRYNISFETISENFKDIPIGNGIYFKRDKLGIVPELLYSLHKRRMEYQRLMRECEYGSDDYIRYKSIQKAYKIFSNSMYGIFGFVGSRIYNVKCAKSVTFPGKKIIKKTIEVAERLGLKVLYAHSVSKDSEILIDENTVKRIEDMWNECDSKIIKGDKRELKVFNKKVLTVGKNYKTKKSLCTSITRHKINEDIYRIYLTNSNYVDVTKDHSLIVFDNDGNLKDVTVNELKDIKYVISPKYIRERKIESKNFSEEMYIFLGLFISDGYITNNNYKGKRTDYYFGIRQRKEVTKELVKKVVKKISKEYNFNIRFCGDGYGISCCSISFVNLLKRIGIKKGSKNKRIPGFMFNETEENICYLLKGLFSGDGSMMGQNSPVIKYDSVSEGLIKDLQRLLKCVGINSNYFKNKVNSYLGKVAEIPTYGKCLIIKERDVFRDKIGFLYDYQIKKLKLLDKYVGEIKIPDNDRKKILGVDNCNKTSLIRKKLVMKNINKVSKRCLDILYSDLSFSRIKKIEKIKCNDYVYDLSVPKTEIFVANNIFVHNTDSILFVIDDDKERTKEELKELGEKYSKEIEKEVRKILPKNDLLPDVSLDLVFEKICLSAFFNENVRNRNAKFVIYDDGEFLKEPKLEVTGFQSIRSDTPKIIQKLLNNVFTMILSGKGESEVLEIVNSFGEKFMSDKFDIVDISIPIGIKVEIPDELHKGLAYHVKGAVNYNRLFEDTIRVGDKVKVCYVKTNSFGIDVISFPNSFPKKLEVDYKKMWEKRYKNVFIDIFECMSWYSLKTGSYSLSQFNKKKMSQSVEKKKVGGLFNFSK